MLFQGLWGKLLKFDLLNKVIKSYSILGLNALVPLVIIPVIVPNVGITGWGIIASVMAIGMYISIVIEGGAHLFGTREIAKNLEDIGFCRSIFLSVIILRSITAGILIAVTALVFSFTDVIPFDPSTFWTAVLWGIGVGFSPAWYFLGQQRIVWAAGCDVFPKIVALSLSTVFVTSDQDIETFFVLLATFQAGSLIVSYLFVLYLGDQPGTDGWKIERSILLHTIRRGGTIYLLHIVGSFYNTFPVVFVGQMFSLEAAGVYAIADRTVRSIFNVVQPLRQVIYPKVISLSVSLSVAARRVIGNMTFMFIAFSILVMTLLVVSAGFLNEIVFSSISSPEVQVVIAILAVQMCLQNIANCLATNYLLPSGKDGFYLAAVLVTVLVVMVFGGFWVSSPAATQFASVMLAGDAIGLGIILYFSYAVKKSGRDRC